MKIRILLAIPAFAALAVLAGPYDQPWALIEAGNNSDVRKEARASIGECVTKFRKKAAAPQ